MINIANIKNILNFGIAAKVGCEVELNRYLHFVFAEQNIPVIAEPKILISLDNPKDYKSVIYQYKGSAYRVAEPDFVINDIAIEIKFKNNLEKRDFIECYEYLKCGFIKFVILAHYKTDSTILNRKLLKTFILPEEGFQPTFKLSDCAYFGRVSSVWGKNKNGENHGNKHSSIK